jgi:predicted Rossmann-fold nucleotide-binding protein
MHFLARARALVAFPGGFDMLDEVVGTLTLIQTKKIKPVPVHLSGRKYWQYIINLDALLEEGTIDAQVLDLFQQVETATLAEGRRDRG